MVVLLLLLLLPLLLLPPRLLLVVLGGTTTSTKGMITPTPFNIDINNDLNDFDGKFIETFKPDLELQKKYRLFIQREGALSFLRTEITQSMSKRDICVLILNLGYPKKPWKIIQY